jgi:hypothetical protein
MTFEALPIESRNKYSNYLQSAYPLFKTAEMLNTSLFCKILNFFPIWVEIGKL